MGSLSLSPSLPWAVRRPPRVVWGAGTCRAVWFGVAAAANAALVASGGVDGAVDRAVEASLVTCCVAVAARHDGIVRGAFVLGRTWRSYALHQLTYHLGQLHRAMAIAATAWLLVALAGAAASDRVGAVIGGAALTLFLAMIVTARDAVRSGRHDRFEAVHRYGGWTALVLVVVLVVRRTAAVIEADGLVSAVASPAPWLLIALVGLVAHPWIGVRRAPVQVDAVTDQLVVLSLAGPQSVGEFARVSSDGREWHSFAVSTTGVDDGRYRLVVRRAGDWTERLARDAEQGTLAPYLWVRRMRGTGFMYHAAAYQRVLFVATGAGIAPVLPYLLGPGRVPGDCVWVAHDHRRAVGDALVDRVVATGRVRLVDTAVSRPDVGALVGRAAAGYDAVFVVANAIVRDAVAAACRRAGVRWYGPTFDS